VSITTPKNIPFILDIQDNRYTAVEAEEVGQLLSVHPLLGATATETAIKHQLSQARLIHFATHGLFNESKPLEGAIALAPGGQDGLLTASEIMDFSLQAELVVLSACDTGRGRITGDGVIGLSRSFLAAGAQRVMVSLWQVPDEATAHLMVAFYRQLRQGQTEAQALRSAMLTTIRTYPNPRDWAAFTVMGGAE
jgi:CHAT domain-containing protein